MAFFVHDMLDNFFPLIPKGTGSSFPPVKAPGLKSVNKSEALLASLLEDTVAVTHSYISIKDLVLLALLESTTTKGEMTSNIQLRTAKPRILWSAYWVYCYHRHF